MDPKYTSYSLLKNVLFLLFFTAVNLAYSNWDPQFLTDQSLIDKKNLDELNNPRFSTLKSDIIAYLANSWCSPEKATLIMDLICLERPTKCVEIGVFTGSSFLPIAATLKYLGHGLAYAVEPWSNKEAIEGMDATDPNKGWWQTVNMKSVQDRFQNMLKTWALTPYCSVLKKTSEIAVDKLDQIDFLHMDGNYTTSVALADAISYLPKVKVGGFILFSNLFVSVNGNQPKMEAFFHLLETCEIICELDSNNTVLLKKVSGG